MAEYESLKTKYYKLNDESQFEKAYDGRFDNEVAVKSGLKIKPILRGERTRTEYEIFFIPIQDIQKSKEEISKNSRDITKLLEQLPPLARNQIFLNNLIDELQSTNDIEGVHSSRKELGEVVDQVLSEKITNKRFNGLVKQYMKFQNDDYNNIHSVEEFRSIYDELVSKEIEKSELPDGKLFRTESVAITDSAHREIHTGTPSEELITKDLDSLVKLMNNKEITSLEKCFISHYFYEYVHPFYDGNGRTGRFIACSYLSRKLDYMSAINFSSAVVKHKDAYYSAFSNMSDIHNRAEATNFILEMMKLLIEGQRSVLENLKYSISLIEKAYKLISEISKNETQKEIMFVLFQKASFGQYVGKLTDIELANAVKISRYLLDKEMKTLIKNDLVVKIADNPIVHTLSDELKSKISKSEE